MANSLRKIALELNNLDSKEVVKVAGLLRRLKNWFKGHTDPDYKSTVELVKQDAEKIQFTLNELEKELKIIQEAIKDGEIEEYNVALNSIKELTSKLWMVVKQTSQDSAKYYTLQDMESPGFQEWFKQHLPKEYDVELGTIYNKPLKETKWYQNIDPNTIVIEAGALNIFLRQLSKALLNGYMDNLEEIEYSVGNNTEELLTNFKDGIVNGVLISANVRKPNEKFVQPAAGTTEIQVLTAPFDIPKSNLKVQAKISLIDSSTSDPNKHKLSLRKTDHIIILGRSKKKAQRLGALYKLAAQVPYKATPLTEMELAEVMRQGYKMVFGSDPTAEVLAVGWAQIMLENARGKKIYNNNFGNLKATDEWIKSGSPYALKSTEEYTAEGKHYVQENAPWRVYNTPVEGAAAYWKLLGKNYSSALDWMKAGDPESASVSLGLKGYYTANIQKYTKGISGLYAEFMNKIVPGLSGIKSLPITPPGEKLTVKNWKSDYSPEEKQIALNKSPSNEIDSLMKDLTVASFPLTNFVKTAILKTKLPRSSNLILISSNDFGNSLYYAQVCGNLLKKFADTTSSIHAFSNDKIEIQCTTLGDSLTTYNAIRAICDSVSEIMKIKTQIEVSAIVAPNLLSKFAQVELSKLSSNYRKFQLKLAQMDI